VLVEAAGTAAAAYQIALPTVPLLAT
jgi:hypothetical protein